LLEHALSGFSFSHNQFIYGIALTHWRRVMVAEEAKEANPNPPLNYIPNPNTEGLAAFDDYG
jgi:hypothetical protein